MNADSSVRIDPGGEEIVVAHVSGEIDLSNATRVRTELAEAVPNRALGLVVDLAETTYFDSSGVSLVFELAERLRRRQQQLRVVVPDGAPLLRVLRIVDAGGTVPVVGSVEEAESEIRAAV